MADDVLRGDFFRCDQGDAVQWLDSLPADSVDLVLCSPPYERARTYLENGADLGIARDTEPWVSWMLEVCLAARRVCTGLCAFVVEGQTRGYCYSCAPFLLVADLHRRGFHLRKPPIYRRVGIPGSGGPDWLRNDYEPVVCFTRGGKLPWSDNTACGHAPKWAPGGEMSHRLTDGQRKSGATDPWMKRDRGNHVGGRKRDGTTNKGTTHGKSGATRGYRDGDTLNEGVYVPPAVANPGNVAGQLYTAEEVAALLAESGDVCDCKAGGGQMGARAAHENEAPFPEKLCELFVRSFCPPGGIVLDPFSGSGTTAAVAVRWGRRALCCDLRESQVALTRRRVAEEIDLFHSRPEPDAPPPTPGCNRPAAPGLFDALED